jgi:hypothetical protein
MKEALNPIVAGQLVRLALEPGRPLIVCDADEVLFAFMAGFERFLHRKAHYFAWRNYELAGNVRRRGEASPVDPATVEALLSAYWAAHAETMSVVAGAPEALRALAMHAQVLILTNTPLEHQAARGRALARRGLNYPMIVNVGLKGPAVEWLSGQVAAATFFVDDSPRHHRSVAAHAESVVRLQFIGDRRLAGLLGPAAEAHYRTDTWAAARAVIERELGRPRS